MIISTPFIQKTTVAAIILFASSFVAISHSKLLAQTADVKVKGPTVDCDKVDTKVTAPSPEVSVPNPSKLVPNVGKILRKGLGVPAPDSNAPRVEVPKVSTGPQNATCPTDGKK
jgi:hypothetical protein